MAKGVEIIEIKDKDSKYLYTKEILEKLSQWFGNKRARDQYSDKVRDLSYFAAIDGLGKCIGFLSIKTHYRHTAEIFACGILPEYQRNGIGKDLYRAAENVFVSKGCKYAIVKTLSDAVDYKPYDGTRGFYNSIGFEPLITLTEMWDKDNPCLIMFKSLL